MLIGYARVFFDHKNLTLQLDSNLDFGYERKFEEKVSGSIRHLPILDKALDLAMVGNILEVLRFDRMSRSIAVRYLRPRQSTNEMFLLVDTIQ